MYLHDIGEGLAKGKRPDISVGCVVDTVFSHDQTGDNYVWLEPEFGRLQWVEFEEPAGSGQWVTYDRYYWTRHGCIVSHDPERLLEDHVRTYVDPRTKTINLRFWFELPSGRVYSAAPTRRFYELERDYFSRHGLCQSPEAIQRYLGTHVAVPVGPINSPDDDSR